MLPATARPLFRFCQLDFPFPLGPADGRYLSREGDAQTDVIIFKTLGAQRRGLVRGRRPKAAEPGGSEPEPVPVSRVSVIDSAGFEDEAAAREWLDRCRRDTAEREQAIERALAAINRAVHAHRISAADPYRHELAREQVNGARLGYGAGDDVAEGHWSAAYSVPARRLRQGRRQMLAPQEQLAAILSGRRPAHASEDLALRARLDLEQGRPRQAAIQLRAAFDALEAELAAPAGDSSAGEAGRTPDAARDARRIAEAALAGELDDARSARLGELLDEIERPLRRRRHAGA